MATNLPDVNMVKKDIGSLKQYWTQRNKKFLAWMEALLLVDTLAAKGLESYVTNEPMTFYNMAHFLLTRGELSHSIPIEDESALELDRRARVDRGCRYMWNRIDRDRQLGGNMAFLDELGFYLLVLGWYGVIYFFDKSTGLMTGQIWNPSDVYPYYANNTLLGCVHSYKISEKEAVLKAQANGWNYKSSSTMSGDTTLDDYFRIVGNIPYNLILIDGKPVTGWEERPEMLLLVSPVGGFPDKGSITSRKTDWKKLTGRSIFEANEQVSLSFNKWKTMVSQILRDTAQPVHEEFSATPQATPEQIRERGALFHYAPGEQGLQRLPPAAIPVEIQAHLLEMRRELQKGSFNDAVFGMMEGQPGYALSLMATSSANQILYPYMDAKHFVIGEGDRFWLSSLKASKRVFNVKGKFIEKVSPTDIPDDVNLTVESDVATPQDWLERGTIANQLTNHFDRATILRVILKQSDPQAILRGRSLDRVLDNPLSQQVEMAAGYYSHADYLENRGDKKQADLFRRAAQAVEAQIGAPAPGQGKPAEMIQTLAERVAGAPQPETRVAPSVQPPERGGGFTPQELRRTLGRGKLTVR